MATFRKLKKSFVMPEKRAGGFGESKYDWDTILSGEVIPMDKGTHYECDTKLLMHMAYAQARRRGLTVRLIPVDENDKPTKVDDAVCLVVQAEPASPDQVAKWEAADAERKERQKAKRAEKRSQAKSNEAA